MDSRCYALGHFPASQLARRGTALPFPSILAFPASPQQDTEYQSAKLRSLLSPHPLSLLPPPRSRTLKSRGKEKEERRRECECDRSGVGAADASISVSLQTATEDVTIIFQNASAAAATHVVCQRHGRRHAVWLACLGVGEGREGVREGWGIPSLLHPSSPRGHPVQMGNRNDLEAAASVTSLGDRVSRQ